MLSAKPVVQNLVSARAAHDTAKISLPNKEKLLFKQADQPKYGSRMMSRGSASAQPCLWACREESKPANEPREGQGRPVHNSAKCWTESIARSC